MEKIELQTELDWGLEAISFLMDEENDNQQQQWLSSCKEKSKRESMKKFEAYDEICSYIRKNINVLPKEEIHFYFQNRKKGYRALYANLVLLTDYQNSKDIDYTSNYEDRFQGINDAERLRQMMRILKYDEEIEWNKNTEYSFADFAEELNSLELEKEERWEIFDLFLNHKKHYKNVISILQNVVERMKDQAIKIESLKSEYLQEKTSMILNGDIFKELEEKKGVKWEHSSNGAVFKLLFFLPFSTTVSTDSDKSDCADVIRMGIFEGELSRCKAEIHKPTMEEVMKFGKILSDKSKIEILKMLKTKTCFGKEIADAMNLSTATISHHMNALLELELISVRVEAKRVYYSLNEEILNSRINALNEYFK